MKACYSWIESRKSSNLRVLSQVINSISIMRKIIVDFQKLNTEVLDLLVETYPDGYADEDIISYRSAQGEIVDCVRVTSEDTIYLVKVSKRLILAMEDHEVEDDDDMDDEQDIDDNGYSSEDSYDNYEDPEDD